MSNFHEASTPVSGAAIASAANVLLTNVPCNAAVYVGAAVRMDTLGVAQNALADSLTNSNLIGVCESKVSATVCNIRVLGVTPAIYAGLDVTKEYFLSESTAGLVTTTVPVGSGSVIVRVGQPFSGTKILVIKGQRIERA